jgi:hypothetical protein
MSQEETKHPEVSTVAVPGSSSGSSDSFTGVDVYNPNLSSGTSSGSSSEFLLQLNTTSKNVNNSKEDKAV